MPQELIAEDLLIELKGAERNKETGKAIRTKGKTTKFKTTKFKMPVPSTAKVVQYRSNPYKINQQLVRHCTAAREKKVHNWFYRDSQRSP